MNDIKVTVKGWVASDVTRQISKAGVSYTNFRIATTPRYRNSDGQWEDGKTEWITTCVFKEPFLSNVVNSIKKGDPVVATGSLYTNDFIREDKTVSKNLELRLDSIGHDISLGTSQFERVKMHSDIVEQFDKAEEDGESEKSAENKKPKKVKA